MRIACVHVPQFALQSLTRIDPSLRGAPVAVVGAALDPGPARLSSALHGPVVQACSRAAWSLGIRLGMTGTAANAIGHAAAPGELRVVIADPQLERETVRALADALLGPSGCVDLGGRVGAGGAHLAIYCEVPSKTRGASFGDKLVQVLDALGLAGRIGIADDRFTAWVAAAHGGAEETGVVSVPRGGSAAFLAPRPLSLLAITPEVQHMLEALGVRTLGEFAALPAPSVARPIEADYQALARGDSGQTLRPYAPEAPIREDIVVSASLGLGGAVALLAERCALRLTGRGRGAARLELTVANADGERVVPIHPLAGRAAAGARVLESAEDLAEAFTTALDGVEGAWRLRVTIIGEALAGDAEVVPSAPAADAVYASVHPLAVVLSSTGSQAQLASWQLTSPLGSPSALRSERRDAHRRTRRGKQHRRTVAAGVLQPRLPLVSGERK